MKRKIVLTPPQVMVFGFFVLILLGALLLLLPGMTRGGQPLAPLDALFTATSAVCVTGLIVADTGLRFTVPGQIVILSLIQIGGLGFMALSTIMFVALGKRIGLRERLLIRESLGQLSLQGLVRLVRYVLSFTLVVEVLGALILFVRFAPAYGTGKGLYLAVFHAVSAFCNAGFDIFGPITGPFSSLIAFAGDPLVNLVIAMLIIIGGIGFVVIADIYSFGCRRTRRLTLHTRVAMIATAILILTGALAVFLMEYSNPSTLASLPLGHKILASLFQSVTSRTAGFNSINIGAMHPATLMLLVILMFIGASPGGTGGGIKTTTFSLLLISIYSLVSGRRETNIFERRIPDDLILRAMAISFLSMVLVIGGTMILMITEKRSIMQILFEVTSAFGTVGLSTGITPSLSVAGRIIISLTMFLGRVGPLTFAIALAQRQKCSPIVYPEERIPIG